LAKEESLGLSPELWSRLKSKRACGSREFQRWKGIFLSVLQRLAMKFFNVWMARMWGGTN
jgi:hypothetical protein